MLFCPIFMVLFFLCFIKSRCLTSQGFTDFITSSWLKSKDAQEISESGHFLHLLSCWNGSCALPKEGNYQGYYKYVLIPIFSLDHFISPSKYLRNSCDKQQHPGVSKSLEMTEVFSALVRISQCRWAMHGNRVHVLTLTKMVNRGCLWPYWKH